MQSKENAKNNPSTSKAGLITRASRKQKMIEPIELEIVETLKTAETPKAVEKNMIWSSDSDENNFSEASIDVQAEYQSLSNIMQSSFNKVKELLDGKYTIISGMNDANLLLKQQVDESTVKVVESNVILLEKERKILSLERELNEISIKFETVETKNTSITADLQQLNDKVEAKDRIILNLQKELRELKLGDQSKDITTAAEVEKMNETLKEKNKEISKLNEKLSNLDKIVQSKDIAIAAQKLKRIKKKKNKEMSSLQTSTGSMKKKKSKLESTEKTSSRSENNKLQNNDNVLQTSKIMEKKLAEANVHFDNDQYIVALKEFIELAEEKAYVETKDDMIGRINEIATKLSNFEISEKANTDTDTFLKKLFDLETFDSKIIDEIVFPIITYCKFKNPEWDKNVIGAINKIKSFL